MKKMLPFLCSLLIIMSCLASCNHDADETTPGKEETRESTTQTSATEDSDTETEPPFVSPTDEMPVLRTIVSENEDGLKMEITLHGYASESLGKTFYVKNNEYFLVDVQISNTSENSFYQCLPTWCRHFSEKYNHEIFFDISDEKGNRLNSSAFAFDCPETIDVWKIEPDQSYDWTLKLAAGSESSENFDLPADGNSYTAGIQLYDSGIYENGICDFEGTISFLYALTDHGSETQNDCNLSAAVSFEVVDVFT